MEGKEVLEAAAERANKAGQANTPFLSPQGLLFAKSIAKNYGLQTQNFGGYEEAERRMLSFYQLGEEVLFPISCLKIQAKAELTHRQVLGSVLALGLEREIIGDILLEGNTANLYCMTHMANHIASQLSSVGKQNVEVQILENLPDATQQKGEIERLHLSSLRVDALLAAALHLSRSNALALLAQQKVLLNHSPCEKADKKLGLGDILSVRGFGRIKLIELGNISRKGRQLVLVESHIQRKTKR